MKRMLAAALLLISAVPAFAQPYAEIGLGVTFGQSVDTQTYTLSAGGNTAIGKINLDYDAGLAAGAEVGYAGLGMPELRLGLGYDYLEGKFQTGRVVGTVNGTPGSLSFNRADAAAQGVNLDNNLHFLTGNAYYDLPAFGAIQPYLGGGLGAAFIDHADTKFAMNASAGLRYPVSDNAWLGVRYRFYWVDSPAHDSGIKFDPITAHSVMATLGMNLD